MGKKLTIGTILNTTVDSRANNGESVAAAMVTRIKQDEDNNSRVNLRVFLDTGADIRYSFIPLVDKQPEVIAPEYPEKVAWFL